MLILKAINTYVRRLEGKSERYQKSKEAEAELSEEQTCKVEYMKACAESLKEALDRGSTVGVAEAYKKLVLKLEKFKAAMQTTSSEASESCAG